MRSWWSTAEAFANPVTGFLSAVILVVLAPILVWHALGWLLALAATPVVWLGRTTMGRPWPVVARCEGTPPREYRGSAESLRTADALVDHVEMEIRRYGEPRSLAPT
jgi:hypothetical protein